MGNLITKLSRNIFWLYYVKHLNFEEKELAKLYKELANKGVDIVEVACYKCTRDYGGAPDEEYALYSSSEVLPIAEEVRNVDLLKLQVDLAHEFGLLTRTYINAHWYGEGFYKKHRDWVQVKADGSPINNLYGHGYSMCVNTSYRDRMIKFVLEVASRGVDIIFLDGPAYYPGACYCKACKKKFYEIYGDDIPEKEDWNNRLWRRFVKFRYQSLANFLIDIKKALRNAGYKTLIYSNTSGQTWPTWQFALSMEELWDGEDILAAECYQYYKSTIRIPIWLYEWTARYGNSVKKFKPFCLFLSSAHAPWSYYRIPDCEREIATFQGIANGANILEYDESLKDLLALTKKWRKYFEDIKSMANVAMLWSRSSADFIFDEPSKIVGEVSFEVQAVQVGQRVLPRDIKSESLRRYVEEVRGFYEMLLRLHVPFDLISDINLNKEDLSKYDVLILPSSVCISEEAAKVIRGFVKNGGGLIASYEVGLRNEFGDPYDDCILSNVLNIKCLGKIYGPLPWDYIKIVRQHPIVSGVPLFSREKGILPAPEYCLLVETDEESIVAKQLKHLSSRYEPLEKECIAPAIIATKYGKGRVVYFTGTFGYQYWNYGFLDYVKIVDNALKWINPKGYPLELYGPETLGVTLYKGESWYVIFISNYNYSIRRPFAKVYKVFNVKLKMKIPCTPSRVKALVQDIDLKYDITKEGLIINLPEIEKFEVVLIEE